MFTSKIHIFTNNKKKKYFIPNLKDIRKKFILNWWEYLISIYLYRNESKKAFVKNCYDYLDVILDMNSQIEMHEKFSKLKNILLNNSQIEPLSPLPLNITEFLDTEKISYYSVDKFLISFLEFKNKWENTQIEFFFIELVQNLE